ncbi:MAG: WYL domain-containing protein [Rikenellaceae bacterium]
MKHISRYVKLLSIIKRRGDAGISFEEIAEQWCSAFDEESFSKRTFHHQKGRIEEVFGVEIVCDRSTSLYRIEGGDAMRGDSVQKWLLDTFSVTNTISSCRSLQERILVDEVPSSHQWLTTILDAMKQCLTLDMRYQSFKADEPSDMELEPYFVKQHNNRWYLYGVVRNKNEAKLKLYALDRVQSLEIGKNGFALPNDFSANDTLYTAFGVAIYDDVKPRLITLKTYEKKSKYLDSLPLHHSQCKLSDDTYEIYVAPTDELYNRILSHASDIEIVSPAEVRDEFKSRLKKVSERYV